MINTRKLSLIAVFAALTAVSAYVSLPVGSVPFTLQVLVVILSGIILGPYLGGLSQAAYVMVGAAGVPVFHNGSAGLGIIFGPTGGFLFGFIAGAFTAGIITRKSNNIYKAFAGGLAAVAVIYIFGGTHFSLVMSKSLNETLKLAVIPFIPFDLVKAVLAVLISLSVARSGVLEQVLSDT